MDLFSYIPSKQYRYYYSQLEHHEQIIYRKLLDGFLRQKKIIQVHLRDAERLSEIHKAICYDVPEIFYVKSLKVQINSVFGVAMIYPLYRFDSQICAAILDEMETKSTLLLSGIKMLSVEEQLKKIHDYLIQHVTYKDIDAPYSHEAPGSILYGIGVCESISKALKYYCDRLDIQAIVATGKTSTNSESGHAWNIIFIDGLSYHIDVTFDGSLSDAGIIRYDYFLLSDSQIQVDHIFDNLPACMIGKEYYKEIGCFTNTKRELENLISRKLTPDAPFVFQMPFLENFNEQDIETVFDIVTAAVPSHYGFSRSISLVANPKRMIFQVELQ